MGGFGGGLHGFGDEDFPGLGGVFAELAGGVDFRAKDIVVADAEDGAVADANALQDVLLRGLAGVVELGGALHVDGALEGAGDGAEDDEHAVAFDLEKDAVVAVHAGGEDALGLIDDLEEVDDAELGDVAGEAGEIGEHDGPGLAKEIPDAGVQGGAVCAGGEALCEEFFQTLLRGVDGDFVDGGHEGLHAQKAGTWVRGRWGAVTEGGTAGGEAFEGGWMLALPVGMPRVSWDGGGEVVCVRGGVDVWRGTLGRGVGKSDG